MPNWLLPRFEAPVIDASGRPCCPDCMGPYKGRQGRRVTGVIHHWRGGHQWDTEPLDSDLILSPVEVARTAEYVALIEGEMGI